MKKFTFLLIVSYLFCAEIDYSQGLNSVHSPDGNVVFAVGNEGSVYHSTDGGATFNTISLGLNKLYGVYSLNQKVWVAGENGVNVSTDGGATFNFVPVTGMILKSIFFTDGNTGWAAGNSGYIGLSTDGGMSWNAQSTPSTSDLNSIKFSDNMNGIACGNNGVILNTSNGGATWNNIVNVFGDNNLLSLDFKYSYAIATSSNGFILKSTNNGNNWDFIDYQIVTRSQVRGVSITGQNTFYSCGGGGFIRKSIDGGASFSFQQNPMMANLSSIFFYDSLRGWAVNQNNDAVMSTSDGGASWLLPTGTTVSMSWRKTLTSSGNIGNSLAPHPQNKNGMFVICGSTVYRSLDLGETWIQLGVISFSGQAHSLYVYPKDTNMFIASIGSYGDGRVVKSTDYGSTWISVWGPGSLTDYGVPMAVDPNHPNIAYLAPTQSPVLRSTDFGNNWATWSTMSFTDPCDIVVTFDNSNIMYFGDQNTARVYKSTDAGINWDLLYAPGGAEIPMLGISNLNLKNVYFTNWGGSGFWRSTNGGLNFSLAFADNSAWGTDVAKDDPTAVAFASWGNGMSYVSTNNGNNFVSMSVGSFANYGVYFYDKANLILQEDDGLYKLNVNYSLLVSDKKKSASVPEHFALYQNYPNPFNPSTKIRYDLPVNSVVTVTVYDVLGRVVSTILNGKYYNPGEYTLEFNAANLSSGVYFYKIDARDAVNNSRQVFLQVKKMVLIK